MIFAYFIFLNFRMFSAFKKLANRNEVPNGQNGAQVSPGGVQSMASNLQKKFSKVWIIPLSLLVMTDKIGVVTSIHVLSSS